MMASLASFLALVPLLSTAHALHGEGDCGMEDCTANTALLPASHLVQTAASRVNRTNRIASAPLALKAETEELSYSRRFRHAVANRVVLSPVLFASFAVLVSIVGAYLVMYRLEHVKVAHDLVGSFTSERWWLIVISCLVQVVSSSIYGIGAWQDELRDVLGISMNSLTLIGAASLMGLIASPAGGAIYDAMGPRAAVLLGSCLMAVGYSLIGLTTVAAGVLPPTLIVALASLGSLLAGYGSECLLDNTVCMACSESFPQNRGVVVGCVKAAVSTSSGLWALVWDHMFEKPNGPGLPSYLACMAMSSFGIGLLALPGIKVLPRGEPRQPFDYQDHSRLIVLGTMLTALAVYDVVISFYLSEGSLQPSRTLGYSGIALQMAPLGILLTVRRSQSPEELEALKEEASSPKREVCGVPFLVAAQGLDFWLLILIQFALVGGSLGILQNMALVMESAGHSRAASAGVALFSFTSALSRILVGVLSDKYSKYLTRLHWIIFAMACAALGFWWMSFMDIHSIMLGALLEGFSLGCFWVTMVPLINEMYGSLDFGKIWLTQVASQSLSSAVSILLFPAFYQRAAGGKAICVGADCFRMSFLLIAMLDMVAVAAAVLLQLRNSGSKPRTRLLSH
ncbi:NFD4 [Symbiodinium sp. KB8]|nr:NFD4 [Symbiodinium sp. KB8]